MRVLFHYTHKQTLGHTTRSISLAAALGRCKAEVLILQGGIPQPFVRFPPECRRLDIPLPFDDRTSFQARAVPVSGAKRAQFILQTAAEFSPDVFITEFFPFGRLAYLPELLPALRYLRKKGVRIVASIGYPLLIDIDRLEDPKFAALHRAIFAFYDQFLIHTPPGLEDSYMAQSIKSPDLLRRYVGAMKELQPRIAYTGYVFPEKIIRSQTLRPADSLKEIVISRGGGAVYPNLITLGIKALRLLGDKVSGLVACGPATSAQEMSGFKSCLDDSCKDNIFMGDCLEDLDDHFRTCRVSVSLCGYNTSVQLMRYGTPAVIVPYQNSASRTTTNDQVARARLLKERFSSLVLDYDAMSERSLAEAIEKQMSSPRPIPAPREWFDGAQRAADLILARDPARGAEDTAN